MASDARLEDEAAGMLDVYLPAQRKQAEDRPELRDNRGTMMHRFSDPRRPEAARKPH